MFGLWQEAQEELKQNDSQASSMYANDAMIDEPAKIQYFYRGWKCHKPTSSLELNSFYKADIESDKFSLQKYTRSSIL